MRTWLVALMVAVVMVAGIAPVVEARGKTETIPIMDGATAIAASGTYSGTVDDGADAWIDVRNREGFFTLEVEDVTGTGTFKAEYQIRSEDATTGPEPNGASDILTGVTATSGPAGDGNISVQFATHLGAYIRIVLTETGGAASVTPTINLILR